MYSHLTWSKEKKKLNEQTPGSDQKFIGIIERSSLWKKTLNCLSMMGNHDYIIYFIDRIFDVLIKKVFSFRTSMKIITGNE